MRKIVAGSEVQSLKRIGINDLAEGFVRFLSNLKSKEFKNSVFLINMTKGGIIDFNSLEKQYNSTYCLRKGQKRFYGDTWN